jgi:dGTPase
VTDELNQSALQLPSEIAVSGDAQSELARRAHAEPPHPYRSPFARDAARILHARSFRRLAGKTQVFTRLEGEPPGDHFRSRLTHTLEVAQISRTLANALGLNRELAEALALVHDIGHPPFGHAGEKALDEALQAHGLRFDHNLHALRIVTWFEERYPAFRGLNLTLAVREGIVKHSRDGLDSGILAVDEVREAVPLFRSLHDNALRAWPAAIPRLTVYEALRSLLNVLVTDLINEVRLRVAALGATTLADIRNAPGRMASLSPAMEETRKTAKSFLYQQLYNSSGMEELHAHAAHVVKSLFGSIMADPSLLPKDHQAQIPSEGLARTVADYIAGMTDTFIEQLWARCGGQ